MSTALDVTEGILLFYMCQLWPYTGGAENARLENAELENAAPNCRTGKRETGKSGTKLQDWKTRD